MASRSKTAPTYQWRLFMLVMCFSWVLVGCFIAFQYSREKEYKAQMLDSQLQMFNSVLLDRLSDGESITETVELMRKHLPGLRISIIGYDGRIKFDNTLDSLPATDHLDRHEIRQALVKGTGYTIRRHSQSDDNTYFYSATDGGNFLVRSAVPYSVSLQHVLAADRGFLWFMLCVTLALSIIAYFATGRIGHTVSRLKRFAEKAEKGEIIYGSEPSFPNDEFGSISRNIVRLYARLQQTMNERDLGHRRALEEEREKIRIKKELTLNINHELKTPVASVMACLETIINHPDLPQDKRDSFIFQSYENTMRLKRLLDDVSTITRLDEGTGQIVFAPTDLSAIINETARDMEPRLLDAGITLDVDVPSGMVVNGSETLLASVFHNLIDNAIAYSGGSVIKVSLEQLSDKNYIFSVSDNGNGIPQSHLPRIFERFYRVDKGRSRKSGGTGLGLSIVKNAIAIHGGSITAANRPEGGFKVTFSIPRG